MNLRQDRVAIGIDNRVADIADNKEVRHALEDRWMLHPYFVRLGCRQCLPSCLPPIGFYQGRVPRPAAVIVFAGNRRLRLCRPALHRHCTISRFPHSLRTSCAQTKGPRCIATARMRNRVSIGHRRRRHAIIERLLRGSTSAPPGDPKVCSPRRRMLCVDPVGVETPGPETSSDRQITLLYYAIPPPSHSMAYIRPSTLPSL
jgi:hypothetical protein